MAARLNNQPAAQPRLVLTAALGPEVVVLALPADVVLVLAAELGAAIKGLVVVAAAVDASVEVDAADPAVNVSAPVAVSSADSTFAPPSSWPFEYELPVSSPLVDE